MVVLFLASLCPYIVQGDQGNPIPSRSDFKITARGITTNLKLLSVFVLPGDSLFVVADTSTQKLRVFATAKEGKLSKLNTRWLWI
ncbi:MAG: hypothetical protein ABII79_14620, partial [bacterium]